MPWNRRAAAHLYRRAAFGATPAELDAAVAQGKEATVNRLLNFESISTAQLDALLASYSFNFTSFYEADDLRLYEQFQNLQRWAYFRFTYSPRPFQEKLALFWHNHFATSFHKVYSPPMQLAQYNLFLQRGAYGFQDLLLEVARDPAMLFYLDNNTNVKDALQENWGRELLELFTLDVNRYTQSDVRAAAAAFTGWTTEDAPPYGFRFVEEYHDYGPKTFLGQTANFDGGDIVAILVRRPETAEFITNKLARFFIGVNPRRALARRLQDLWFGTNGNIKAVVREILMSEEFDESADKNDKIKSPTDFMVGAVRTLGASTDANLLVVFGLKTGQSLFAPPNVAGWPAYKYGPRRWMNTGALFARTSFAIVLAISGPGTPEFSWNTETFFAGVSVARPDDLIDYLGYRFAMPISSSLRDGLRGFLSTAGTPFPWNPQVRNTYGRGAVGLLMASPDYNVE